MSSSAPASLPPQPEIPASPQSSGKKTCLIVAIVVGVVFLGVAFLAPLAGRISRKAETPRGMITAYDLKHSVGAYFIEYRKYPTDSSGGSDTTTFSDHSLMDILLAAESEAISGGLNPRKIVFFSGRKARPTENGGFRKGVNLSAGGAGELWDSYAQYYRVRIDCDLNGSIENPDGSGGTIPATVGVWSAGRDGDFDTWDDNIKTW